MRKRYQQIDKVKALQVLDANGGNIALTVAELEIAERTLRDWDEFRQAIAKAFFMPKEKPELVYPRPLDEEVEDVPEVVQELQTVREKMMRAINHLTEKLDVEDGLIHRRAMAFSRLIDRLSKVDEQIIAWHNTVGHKAIRIEYVYDNQIHDRPIWENRTYDDPSHPYGTPLGDETNADKNNEQAIWEEEQRAIEREQAAIARFDAIYEDIPDEVLYPSGGGRVSIEGWLKERAEEEKAQQEREMTEEERLAMRRQEIMQAQIEAGERRRYDMYWDEEDDRLL